VCDADAGSGGAPAAHRARARDVRSRGGTARSLRGALGGGVRPGWAVRSQTESGIRDPEQLFYGARLVVGAVILAGSMNLHPSWKLEGDSYAARLTSFSTCP